MNEANTFSRPHFLSVLDAFLLAAIFVIKWKNKTHFHHRRCTHVAQVVFDAIFLPLANLVNSCIFSWEIIDKHVSNSRQLFDEDNNNKNLYFPLFRIDGTMLRCCMHACPGCFERKWIFNMDKLRSSIFCLYLSGKFAIFSYSLTPSLAGARC